MDSQTTLILQLIQQQLHSHHFTTIDTIHFTTIYTIHFTTIYTKHFTINLKIPSGMIYIAMEETIQEE